MLTPLFLMTMITDGESLIIDGCNIERVSAGKCNVCDACLKNTKATIQNTLKRAGITGKVKVCDELFGKINKDGDKLNIGGCDIEKTPAGECSVCDACLGDTKQTLADLLETIGVKDNKIKVCDDLFGRIMESSLL